jgi:hypothetical protein
MGSVPTTLDSQAGRSTVLTRILSGVRGGKFARHFAASLAMFAASLRTMAKTEWSSSPGRARRRQATCWWTRSRLIFQTAGAAPERVRGMLDFRPRRRTGSRYGIEMRVALRIDRTTLPGAHGVEFGAGLVRRVTPERRQASARVPTRSVHTSVNAARKSACATKAACCKQSIQKTKWHCAGVRAPQ